MSPLFGPILAQAITLGIGDRTEVRYIASQDKYFEGATTPQVGLSVDWKHTTLSLGYNPSFTVKPLDSEPRNLLIFHNGSLSGSYRWQHSTLTVSQTIGYGELNFVTQALTTGLPPGGNKPPATGGATPPTGGTPTGGTPTGGTPGTPPAGGNAQLAHQRGETQGLSYATSITSLRLLHAASALLTLTGELGYAITGSVGSTKSEAYPTVKGPRLQLSASYRVSRRDALTATVSTQYGIASTGFKALYGVANGSWSHVLSRHASTLLGSGLSISRNSQPDGTVAVSIYPTFTSSIGYASQLARGTWTLGSGVSAAPALDVVAATVDPRLSVFATTGWSRDRFTSALNVNSVISLAEPDARGAFSTINSSLSFGYRLGDAVSVDTGVRGAWQRFEGQNTIPLTWAAFLGLTFGMSFPLTGGA